VTTAGHLPWGYCAPDGTFYQPLDPQTGEPRVWETGKNEGEPVLLPRFGVKPGYEEKAAQYWKDFVEFHAEHVFLGGHEAMIGYSIQRDEYREGIQIYSDPFADGSTDMNPDGLKNAYSLTFGSHRDSAMVPARDRKTGEPIILIDEETGEPLLDAEGEPMVKMMRENASLKMERYQREFREFMIARGHEVEAERDEARHLRSLELEDYKDVELQRMEVTAGEEELAQDQQLVAAEFSEAEDMKHSVADTAAEKYDDAVQDGRGETEAALQAAEARLGTVVAEVTQSLKDGYKEGWDKAEAKAVDTLNAELIKLRDEFDRAKDHAKAEWERDEKPGLVAATKREAEREVRNRLEDAQRKVDAAGQSLQKQLAAQAAAEAAQRRAEDDEAETKRRLAALKAGIDELAALPGYDPEAAVAGMSAVLMSVLSRPSPKTGKSMLEIAGSLARKEYEANVTNAQVQAGLTYEKYMAQTVDEVNQSGAGVKKDIGRYSGPDHDGPSKDFQR
jgi:hypothetical protein